MEIREGDLWVRQGFFRREYRYVSMVGPTSVSYRTDPFGNDRRIWIDRFEDWARRAHKIAMTPALHPYQESK